VSDDNATDRMTYLLIGAGLGAVFALLFAPKSGKEMRDDIVDVSRRGYKKGSDGAQIVGEKVADQVDSVRGTISKQKSNIATAIDAGKQAFKQERGH